MLMNDGNNDIVKRFTRNSSYRFRDHDKTLGVQTQLENIPCLGKNILRRWGVNARLGVQQYTSYNKIIYSVNF